jgi:Protein of unknown function (DUF1460)
MMHRRQLLLSLPGFYALSCAAAAQARTLPLEVRFIGQKKYRAILQKAQLGQWADLPLTLRLEKLAGALAGTPYRSYTLEIDDAVEAPSVNFLGLDCWTFFELTLALAQHIRLPVEQQTPEQLLLQIQRTRYRGGQCRGHYLERIHYLDEWFRDNHQRGQVDDLTRQLGQTVPLKDRRIDEMTLLWKSYRYLRHSPAARAGMAKLEQELESHPFVYLPKSCARAVEPKLRAGDVIGIVTHKPHVYCSHVGLAMPQQDTGRCHFMHASSEKKRVLVDSSLQDYLDAHRSHAGFIVARPLEKK